MVLPLQLQGLWTIQDFWIGHHNLLLRRVDGDEKENLDLRFEGTALYLGCTAIYEPILSAISVVDVAQWIRMEFERELFGRTVFQLSSARGGGKIFIAANVLWRQTNVLAKSQSSLTGKYEKPRTIEEVALMVNRVISGDLKPEEKVKQWQRILPEPESPLSNSLQD